MKLLQHLRVPFKPWAVFIAICFVWYSRGNASSCQFEWSQGNATFDLHPLTLESGGQSKYYTVHDDRVVDATNFTYTFNICEQVLAFPNDCQGASQGYCRAECINATTGACDCDLVSVTDKAFAYQTRSSNDVCNLLGTSTDNEFNFSLLSEEDPSAGVILTYKNGDWCSAAGINREFQLHIACENDARNVPDNEEVFENSEEKCIYNVTLPSIYGCPTECGVHANNLCASQGLCGYDWSNNQAQCFCFHQYSGSDCTQYSDDVVSPETKEAPAKSKWVRTFVYDGVNVTYDLSPFDLKDSVFFVDDTDGEFDYYFNVLDSIPSDQLPDACNTTDGAAAFQYNTENDKCHLLGTANSENDYSVSLFESDDPAKGIIVSYTSGEYCSKSGANRVLNISFECPSTTRDFYSPSEDTHISEFVDEQHDVCQYAISVESALACPYECITNASSTQFSVCSGKGICAADPYAGVVRCLCDAGWTGADCNTKESSGNSSYEDDHTGFQIAIAVISIVLIALIGIVVYMRMKYSSLQKNLQRQLLQDDDEDDEMAMGAMGASTMQVATKADSDDEDASHSDAGVGDAAHDTQLATGSDDDQDDSSNDKRPANDLIVEDLEDNDSH